MIVRYGRSRHVRAATTRGVRRIGTTALVLLLLLGVAGPVAAVHAQATDARELVTFQDPRIAESSGLAVVDGLVVTVNDSGYAPRVYAVDPATGRTVGETMWTGPLRDAEALAPGGGGTVWVGDIGDNGNVRDFVRVVRLPVGRGTRTVSVPHHELRYPDGPRDAETLLVHPGTGQVIVVSKELFGGHAYSAGVLSDTAPVTMRRIASGLLRTATDGAFFPDGRHVILRNYGAATVYRFPSWDEVGRFTLPAQPQGEGLAVAPDGRILLSTEGAGSAVLQVPLPADVRQAMSEQAETGPPPTQTETATATGTSSSAPEAEGTSDPGRTWLLAGAAAVLLVGVAVVVRFRRR